MSRGIMSGVFLHPGIIFSCVVFYLFPLFLSASWGFFSLTQGFCLI